MKILGLSLDQTILNDNSSVASRLREYGEIVERYDLAVLAKDRATIDLSSRVRVYGIKKSSRIFSLFRIYRFLKKLLKIEKYDLISVQDQYFLALIGLCLARKFGLGLELQVHGFEKFSGMRKIIARYILPRSSAVRTVSQRLKKQLVERFRVKEEKITVVPIYTEAQSSKLKVQSSEAKDKFIFLTVGRLVPIKNIAMQIEAMAEVVKKYPESELWIVGDGPEEEKLKVKSEKLKVEENVKFLGRQENLTDFYNRADAFILTSDYEGWGLSVIEAAGFGLPIIMTDVGCAGEVIKSEESGIIIPVGNKRSLIGAMSRLMSDKDLREKLGQNARAAISALPDKEETLKLYKLSWQKALNQ